MYVLRLKGRTNLLKVMLVVVAAMLAAFLLVLVGTAKPAGATFPGQNGKIAYVGCDFPVCDIYTINPDGTGKINPPRGGGFATWSPDGTKIAYQGGDGDGEIYIMDPDGTGKTNLTNNTRDDVLDINGDFNGRSPDGTKIAYVGHTGSNAEIYVMNADGSNEINVSNSPGGDFSPDWSPDRTKITFQSQRDGSNEIYVMDADGSNQTNLTDSATGELSPDWQPLPAPSGPKSKAECKNSGYEDFGFKSQGECVASVQRAPKSK